MELHNLSAEEQYRLLIQFRRDHPVPDGVYGETHHIQPRSCGGPDTKENLVKLLPEEHYKAHALLPQVMLERDDIYGYQKMLYAWNMMRTRVTDIDTESKEYGHLKRSFAEAMVRKNKAGAGKHLTEDHRNKIRAALKGRTPSTRTIEAARMACLGREFTPEHRAKLRLARANRVTTDETRAKISAASKGRRHTDATKALLSRKMKGRKVGPMSQHDKDLRRRKMLDYWAEKKAELLQQEF